MRKQNVRKLVRAGDYADEVDVELLDDDGDDGWGPYLTVADALKLEDVREALKREDLKNVQGLERFWPQAP